MENTQIIEQKFLGIVDADILAYRVAAASENDSLESATDSLDGFINSIVKNTKCKRYIFLLSSSDNYRKMVGKTKEYKGNRKDIVRPKYLKPLRKYLIEVYKGIIVTDGITGYEADDGVAALADRYKGDSIIISTDKDLKQLEGLYYNPVKNTTVETSTKEATRNLAKQLMTGDSTDNIPGLPKIGDKKAEKFLAEADEEGIGYFYKAFLVYKQLGFNHEYLQEQLDLLRMRKDIYIDFESSFVELECVENEQDSSFDYDLEELL